MLSIVSLFAILKRVIFSISGVDEMSNSVACKADDVQDEHRQPFLNCVRAFSVPLVLLTVYFVVRILNFQPTIEMSGLSDLIRAIFLMFGVSVAYFMYLIRIFSAINSDDLVRSHFWKLSSYFLLLILFDDLLMLHETFGAAFGVSDKVLIIMNGGLLGAILLYYRNRFVRPFWVFIGLFGGSSVLAIFLDNTGTYWHVGGRNIDLEQILEVFALLALSSAYATQALHEIRRMLLRE